MRIVASVLIVIGLIVMSYPYLNRMYATHQETKLLDQWENGEVAEASFLSLDQVFAGQVGELDDGESFTDSELIGTLSIEKIELEIPVLDGADLDNLKVAAGKLKGTETLDAEFGNTAIAAHRSYTYGHQFNRLNELEAGDEVVINTKNQTYTYTVYDKLVVEPTDVSVLKKAEDKRMITLITCEPIRKATHRLIIQAKL